jgi:hypothetical protein
MRKTLIALAIVLPTVAHGQALVLAACGSPGTPYTPGQLHALTMNTNGYLCVSSTTTTILVQTIGEALQGPPPLEEPKK